MNNERIYSLTSATASVHSEETASQPDSNAKITSNSTNEKKYLVPIVGYEIMEERARFTVFKINVQCQRTGQNWPVFRRYTDFVRLDKKLRKLFPTMNLSLPPKRWFGDNFDPSFLEERTVKLQTFLNSLISDKQIWQSLPVRQFFCFDDLHDDDNTSKYETSEEMVEKLLHLLKTKESEVISLKSEAELLRNQVAALTESLRLECSLTALSQPHEANVSDIHAFNVALLGVLHESAQKTSPSLTCGTPIDNVVVAISDYFPNKDSVEIAEEEADIADEN